MIFGNGKSNAKVYVKSSEGIRFSDVAGEDEAKENLAEIVDYLHNPGKYREVGAAVPKGILLVGPPEPVNHAGKGCGRRSQCAVLLHVQDLSSWKCSSAWAPLKSRDLFRQAKEKAPCIVFIDEIDAIGQKRDGRVGAMMSGSRH